MRDGYGFRREVAGPNYEGVASYGPAAAMPGTKEVELASLRLELGAEKQLHAEMRQKVHSYDLELNRYREAEIKCKCFNLQFAQHEKDAKKIEAFR